MILSCPNYLHADVSDGEDLFRQQQEVTGGQLVMMSLVCLETELEKRRKKSGISMSVSVPLDKGDRVRTG